MFDVPAVKYCLFMIIYCTILVCVRDATPRRVSTQLAAKYSVQHVKLNDMGYVEKEKKTRESISVTENLNVTA